MSVDLRYFFSSPLPLADLAGVLNREPGCEPSPNQGDETDYFTTLLGIEFTLSGHHFDNDGQLDFESFQYHVDLRTSWGAAILRPIQLPFLLVIGYVLHHRLGYTGIVYDMQILIARYVARGSGPDQNCRRPPRHFPARLRGPPARRMDPLRPVRQTGPRDSRLGPQAAQ